MNRIVLLDEGGGELFSGLSIATSPPSLDARDALDGDDEACPPTLRSVAPPVTYEQSGIFVRDASDDEKRVDENAA